MKRIWLLALVALFLLSSCAPNYIPPQAENPTANQQPVVEVSSNKTITGFFWPTGTETWGNYAGWLADGCSGNAYFSGKYHNGWDIKANSDDAVYAISDGEVVSVSDNGWGDGNHALLIKHYLADGDPFIALYGHVTKNLNIGDTVIGGEKIGVIGIWITDNKRADHLHFGILSGTSIPIKNLGAMECPMAGTNGFVNPREWITTKYPGPVPVLARTVPPQIHPTATLIPVPVPTPTRPSNTLDLKDQEEVIKFLLRIFEEKQPQWVEKLVGEYGAALGYGYAMEYIPPGRNNIQDVLEEVTKAVKNAHPSCLGYEEVDNGGGDTKMTVYLKGLSCKNSGFCDYQEADNTFYFIFNKKANDRWYLVAIGPVQPPFDSYLTNLKQCPK